jgi:hypothetical protein
MADREGLPNKSPNIVSYFDKHFSFPVNYATRSAAGERKKPLSLADPAGYTEPVFLSEYFLRNLRNLGKDMISHRGAEVSEKRRIHGLDTHIVFVFPSVFSASLAQRAREKSFVSVFLGNLCNLRNLRTGGGKISDCRRTKHEWGKRSKVHPNKGP